MPFSPLPETFRADLRHVGTGGVLELGSGDGGFTALLRKHGVVPWTLDRRSRCEGARAVICGDALQPPLRSTFGVVAAANLLRHLWPRIQAEGPVAWRDLVAPAGCLWILEDEPLSQPASARHFRDLQEFLARLLPDCRAPLLSSKEFRRRRDTWSWPGVWHDGTMDNDWPMTAAPVMTLLESGAPPPRGAINRLIAGIERDGISCGRFWWARWQRKAGS